VLFAMFLVITTLQAKTINIAVAANVSYAIKALITEFNKLYPDIKVQVILGSSGKLTAQIKHHAPYDIFMSADMKYPEILYKDGFATTKPVVYAEGSLAYLSKKKQDFSKGINLLEDKDIKKIAVANPKTAPYGIATAEFLKHVKIYEKLKSKFVYGESISQTLSYVLTAADIGFVAKSSLFSPKLAHLKKGIHWEDVDSKLYTPIKQGIVVLKEATDDKEVESFYMFMLSQKAKNILKDFGYNIS